MAFQRGLAPDEHAELAVEMAELVRTTALAGIVARHPDLDGDEVKAELLVILHDDLGRRASAVALGA